MSLKVSEDYDHGDVHSKTLGQGVSIGSEEKKVTSLHEDIQFLIVPTYIHNLSVLPVVLSEIMSKDSNIMYLRVKICEKDRRTNVIPI